MLTNKNLFSNACKLVLCVVFLTSCERKPEFFINGKGYYTQSRCIKDTTYTEWCYHYGYNFFSGKYEMHWGNDTKNECLESVIDTIQVK
jgi:hypothetical protein